jgi:branched-chain amino acid transport system permease protein
VPSAEQNPISLSSGAWQICGFGRFPRQEGSVLTAFAILIDGLVYAAYLFIVAIGLTLIFGVMKILNVAHGSFYTFGAYGAATAVAIYFDRGLPDAGGFLLMVLFAMILGLALGLILERGVMRLVYGRDEVVMVLVTYAAFLVLEDIVILVWGPGSYATYQPLLAAGNIEVGELILSNYDLGLIVVAALLAAVSYWALKFTRYGMLLTAVIFDRETAAAFGINVRVVYTVTFVIGAMLGALGGAIMAPKIAVTLGIGVEVIVLAFAVVAIGGMGSIEGALVGALIVGICRAAAVHLVPQVELFVIYGVMALVLMIRPYGLFVRAQPRKI